MLTSTTSWRYWNWNPSNDRDFIGLPITTVSAAPSTQRQWSQEVRYAGDPLAARELRRRRVRVPPDASSRTPRSSRNRARPPPGSCWRRAPTPRRPGCSTATASTSSSTTTTPAPRCSARSSSRVTDRLRLLPGLRVQLRPEGCRLRSAGLRRPADDQPRADRAAAVGARAAGLPGGRRRHQSVGTDHRRLPLSTSASMPTRPTRPASSRSAST